jgi:hypothetical protein
VGRDGGAPSGQIGETHAAVGAEYVVHLPPMFRDEKTGDFTDDRVLDHRGLGPLHQQRQPARAGS